MPPIPFDTRWLQATIDASIANGRMTRPVVLPWDARDLEITKPIKFPAHTWAPVLRGQYMHATMLHARLSEDDYAQGRALFDLPNSREALFADFTVQVESPLACVARHRTVRVGPGTVTNTHPAWERVYVQGRGLLDVGIDFAASPGVNETDAKFIGLDQNNEAGVLRSVTVYNYRKAAVRIGHAQSKMHLLDDVEWNGGRGTYGVDATGSGSFTARRCRGGQNMQGPNPLAFDGEGGADFALGRSNDAILIEGCDFEGSARLLDCALGLSGAPHAVTIVGGRWAANGLHKDGDAIRYLHGGPFTMLGGTLGDGGAKPPQIIVAGLRDVTYDIRGVDFAAHGSADVFPVRAWSQMNPAQPPRRAGRVRGTLRGNVYRDSAGSGVVVAGYERQVVVG